MDEVLLDDVSDGREQAWHVFAVHPGAAPWIEDRLKLLDDKGISPPRRNIALIMRVSATVQA